MNRAVVRVFFSNGLYKTASIDETVTTEELCKMIARKLAIEKRALVPVDDCTLFECRDDSPNPWKASHFGSVYRVVGMNETPFEVIHGWVQQQLTTRSRFVMIFREQQLANNPDFSAASRARDHPHQKAWRPSTTLKISDLLPGTLGETSPIQSSSPTQQLPQLQPLPQQAASVQQAQAAQATQKKSSETVAVEKPATAPAAAAAPASSKPTITVTSTTTTTPAASTTTSTSPSSENAPAATGSETKTVKSSKAGDRCSVCLVKSSGEEDSVLRQACLKFVNGQLKNINVLVEDIEEFRNGHLIILLLESLTHLSIKPHFIAPKTKEESLANWSSSLKFLQSYGCSIRGAIPEDCYYGTQTTIISVLAIVLKHFQEMPAVTSALRKSIIIQNCSSGQKEKLPPPPAQPAPQLPHAAVQMLPQPQAATPQPPMPQLQTAPAPTPSTTTTTTTATTATTTTAPSVPSTSDLPEGFPSPPVTTPPRPSVSVAMEMAMQQKELFFSEWEKELKKREQEAAEHEKVLVQREKDVAALEERLAKLEKSLEEREKAVALRENNLINAKIQQTAQPVATSPIPVPASSESAGQSGPGSSASSPAPVGSMDAVPQRKGGALLLGMLQRRLTRVERPNPKIIASASLSSAALAANKHSELADSSPALFRVTLCGAESRGYESQTISLKYQPELTVKELLEQVCTRKMLKENDWVLKFVNVDVTCAPELTIGDLGVVALRLCPKSSNTVAASDLGALCDEFDAVVDTDTIPELSSSFAEKRNEALGLRQSTFDIATIQEAQSHYQK